MRHSDYAAALVVGLPLVLILMARIGDFMPAVLFFGTAAFMIFALDIVTMWVLVVPLGLAVAYKAMRGDGRGTKGGRLP